MQLFPIRRLVLALAVTTSLAACGVTEATAPGSAAAASAKGAGTTAPGAYTGTWTQAPPFTATLADGTRLEQRLQLTLAQKGTALDGSAERLTTYVYVDGRVATMGDSRRGRVTGSVTATGISIGITGMSESKISLGIVATLSADSTTLVNDRTGPTQPQTFVR